MGREVASGGGGRRRHSNLQCFLDSVTPTVQTCSLLKESKCSPTSDCKVETEAVEYFALADLWEQFYEWSAYGAGSVVQLPRGEKVVQYYVPYLSAIQLYTNKVLPASRSSSEDNGTDYWSDDDELEKLSRSWSSVSDDSVSNGDFGSKRRFGHLYFEFFEVCSPYGRIPLMDKVYELSQNFPGIASLKSTDLSPASWISVAWYPIYHIPWQHNVKDMSTCFLTYHSISSSFKDHPAENLVNGFCNSNGTCEGTNAGTISLPPFGLAIHKMQGSLYSSPDNGDDDLLASLSRAADSWIKHLAVQHHDFNYFISHLI